MAKPIATVVTDEQYAFIRTKAGSQEMADYLREIIEDYYHMNGQLYPEGQVGKHGGKRPGAGWKKGRKRKPAPKNEGVQE
jgi:hypothetical protein